MNKTLVSFILGLLAGAVVSAMVISHQVANRVERETTQHAEAFETLSKATVAWRERAQTCEARFTTGTIVLEPAVGQVPLAEIPVAHTGISLTVQYSMERGTIEKPTMFIPAQVRVYTNVPGARYQWQDMRTGELRGEFAALPPSAMGQQ